MPPSNISFTINNGSETSDSIFTKLQISAKDDSEITHISISSELTMNYESLEWYGLQYDPEAMSGGPFSNGDSHMQGAWLISNKTYSNEIDYQFAKTFQDGSKNLYLYLKDKSGNTSPGKLATINLVFSISDPEMVSINAGTFTMGQAGVAGPEHEVKISQDFFIGSHEVTAQEYRRCVNTGYCKKKSNCLVCTYGVEGRENFPAFVDWYDAEDYVKWLKLVKQKRYRMCTEAEWEYVAKAGTTTIWVCGNDSSCLSSYAHYNQESALPIDVKGKLPNPWGVYGMYGNAYEWVNDWSFPYYAMPIESILIDPTGATQDLGFGKIFRGGGSGNDASYSKPSFRYNTLPTSNLATGIRLCRSNEIADTTPPQNGMLMINNGATETNSLKVELNLTAYDDMGITGYFISDQNSVPSGSDGGWIGTDLSTEFSKSLTYNLNGQNGEKNVYVWYKDLAGNISQGVNATINASGLPYQTEIAKLRDSSGGTNQGFGFFTAISGNTLVVSAHADDEIAINAGAVHVFEYENGFFIEKQRIVDPTAEENENFGSAIAVDGDNLVIASPGDDYNGYTNSGSVSVYKKTNGVWNLIVKLLPQTPLNQKKFGTAVAISGDTLIVGRPFEDVYYQVGETTYGAVSGGRVYVYSLANILVSNEPLNVFESRVTNDWNGISIDINGNYAVIGGAYLKVLKKDADGEWVQQQSIPYGTVNIKVKISGDLIAVGVPFSNHNGIPGLGKVTVFQRSGESWNSIPAQTIIGPESTAINFGYSLDIQGDYLLVGAPLSTTQVDLSQVIMGAAYLYHFNGSKWNLTKKIISSDQQTGAKYGHSVQLNELVGVVATPYYKSNASDGAVYILK